MIVAKNRAQRPGAFQAGSRAYADAFCPFCEGREGSTPPEIAALRPAGTANSPGWRVRVVPNKYPAVVAGGEVCQWQDGMYTTMSACGAHEVIVESPRHAVSTTDLSAAELQDVLAVYRDRLSALKSDPQLRYAMLFKNVGPAAGASLEHAHSQLVGLPLVPTAVQEELTGSREYHCYRSRCVFCDMIDRERSAGGRIVLDSTGFVAFCPFASRFPFETWILPKNHSSHYDDINGDDLADLSGVLRGAIARIETALDCPAYNYLFHTAPFDSGNLQYYHWHIEILPRLTGIAGFEWGTGCYINPVPPEDAAAALRGVELKCLSG